MATAPGRRSEGNWARQRDQRGGEGRAEVARLPFSSVGRAAWWETEVRRRGKDGGGESVRRSGQREGKDGGGGDLERRRWWL